MYRCLPFLIVFLLVTGGTARGVEPTYSFRTDNGDLLRTSVEAVPAPDGGRIVRTRLEAIPPSPVPGQAAPPAFPPITSTLSLDEAGHFRIARTHSPLVLIGGVLEATPVGQAVSVRAPEITGTVPLGAPLITPVDLIAFGGKRYNFLTGGKQHFAMLVGNPGDPGLLATVTLESAGKETLRLESGEVNARKLHVELTFVGNPAPPASADLYVGDAGEYLKSTLPVVGDLITAIAPARVADGALVTEYAVSGATLNVRRVATPIGYVATLTVGPMDVGSVTVDKAFRPLAMEHLFFGRKFAASIAPGQLQWKMVAGDAQVSGTSDAPWFLAHWLVTDLWENSEPYKSLQPGQRQDCTIFFLELGLNTGVSFSLERLGDVSVPRGNGAESVLHHWRITFAPRVTDLWTDGTRLVKMASSDTSVIVRNGWEKATEGLVAPAPPVGAPAPPSR